MLTKSLNSPPQNTSRGVTSAFLTPNRCPTVSPGDTRVESGVPLGVSGHLGDPFAPKSLIVAGPSPRDGQRDFFFFLSETRRSERPCTR